jgi:hypothetical protein
VESEDASENSSFAGGNLIEAIEGQIGYSVIGRMNDL